MDVYIEVPIKEETIEHLDSIIKQKRLENHNAVINYLIGLYFIERSKEASHD